MPSIMKQQILQQLAKNLKIKIIVLVLAILVWFYVITEKNYQYIVEVPIRPINLRSEKVILNNYPRAAKVKLWGRGKNLLSLMLERDIEVLVNLYNVNTRFHDQIRKQNVNIPRHSLVEVVGIVAPDSIEIILGKLVRKSVPIRSVINIKPHQGYTQVGKTRLIPDSVWIKGTEKNLGEISYVSTAPYNTQNRKNKLSDVVLLIPPEKKDVTIEKESVQFVTDIQKLMEKRITGVPVQVRNVPGNLNVLVIPSHLGITLEGGVGLLANITEKDIVAYIDYRRKQGPNEIGHPAYIETPPGIRTRDVTPQKFKLILER